MGRTASGTRESASLIGEPAPAFRLRNQDEQWVTLRDLLAPGPIVLAFYPLDMSVVCTRQLCDYRDAYAPIRELGVRIVGISPDPPERHREFITARRLQLDLLSDPQRSAFADYGVIPRWLSIQTRGLFAVDRTGVVRYERVEQTMFTHRTAADLLVALRGLEGQL